MQVTEIVPLDKRRCRVCTDAGFAFALYKGELRRYGIEAGGELTKERYREILETVLCARARERALFLLRSHDRTEQEIRRKLRDGLYPEEAVESAVAFLQEYGYVNDGEYGRRYVELYGKSRSRRRIREELSRKGIGREQIETLLGEGEILEQEQILAFLRKKGYDPQNCTPQTRNRLAAALLRRGYSYDSVSHALNTGGITEERGTAAETS